MIFMLKLLLLIHVGHVGVGLLEFFLAPSAVLLMLGLASILSRIIPQF